MPPKEAPAADCLPAAGPPPPGCLQAISGGDLPPAMASRARAAAGLALFADDGTERAAACDLLRTLDGDSVNSVLAPFERDPERRVRVACRGGETRPPKPR